MIAVLLLTVGALATPVTGLLIRPDTRGARHGFEAIDVISLYAWYGYSAVSVLLLIAGVVALRGHVPNVAAGTAVALLVLIVPFGGIHALSVTTGMNWGLGHPLLGALSAVIAAVAITALVAVRSRARVK